jgi:hypothetical protein
MHHDRGDAARIGQRERCGDGDPGLRRSGHAILSNVG